MKTFLPFLLIFLTAVTAHSQKAPLSLLVLQDTYERKLREAEEPIKKEYVAKLIDLKDSFTKAGKLEEAVRVDTELKRMQAEILLNRIAGKWQWQKGSRKKFEISTTGGVTGLEVARRFIVHDADRRILRSAGKKRWELVLSANGMTIAMTVLDTGAKFTAKRLYW